MAAAATGSGDKPTTMAGRQSSKATGIQVTIRRLFPQGVETEGMAYRPPPGRGVLLGSDERQITSSIELRPDQLRVCKKIHSTIQALRVFDDMVTRAEFLCSYSSSSDGRKITCCRAIAVEFNAQINYSQRLIDKDKDTISSKKTQSQRLHEAQSTAAVKQGELEEEIAKLEAKIAKIRAERKSLISDISQCETDIAGFEEEMQKEVTLREDGALESTPFFGLGWGIYRTVETGDGKHMIPFYHGVKALDSLVAQRRGAAEQKKDHAEAEKLDLETERDKIASRLSIKKIAFRSQKSATTKVKREVDSLDQEIKQLGHELTQLFNIQTALKQLVTKYDILKYESEIAEEFLLEGIDEIDFEGFIQELLASKLKFQELRPRNIESAPGANPGAGAAGGPGHGAGSSVSERKQEED